MGGLNVETQVSRGVGFDIFKYLFHINTVNEIKFGSYLSSHFRLLFLVVYGTDSPNGKLVFSTNWGAGSSFSW